MVYMYKLTGKTHLSIKDKNDIHIWFLDWLVNLIYQIHVFFCRIKVQFFGYLFSLSLTVMSQSIHFLISVLADRNEMCNEYEFEFIDQIWF